MIFLVLIHPLIGGTVLWHMFLNYEMGAVFVQLAGLYALHKFMNCYVFI